MIPDSVDTINPGAFDGNPLKIVSISQDAPFDLSVFPVGTKIVLRGSTPEADVTPVTDSPEADVTPVTDSTHEAE